MLNWLLGIIFPIRCLGCRQYDQWLCASCVRAMPKPGQAIGFYRQPALKRAIHLLKYNGYKGIGKQLGAQLAAHLAVASYDVVVPVPLHWLRQLTRGYNQAAVLAEQFPKPVWPALQKTKRTRVQATLNRQERQHNLTGAFQLDPWYRRQIQGQRVLLVDDVLSTGATTQACTAVLLAGGAVSVQVAAIAVNQDHHDK